MKRAIVTTGNQPRMGVRNSLKRLRHGAGDAANRSEPTLVVRGHNGTMAARGPARFRGSPTSVIFRAAAAPFSGAASHAGAGPVR